MSNTDRRLQLLAAKHTVPARKIPTECAPVCGGSPALKVRCGTQRQHNRLPGRGRPAKTNLLRLPGQSNQSLRVTGSNATAHKQKTGRQQPKAGSSAVVPPHYEHHKLQMQLAGPLCAASSHSSALQGLIYTWALSPPTKQIDDKLND